MPSNMLTISFATRTDSTLDPLTERALALATEFMDLTGEYKLISRAGSPDTPAPGPWSNIVDFIEPLQWIPTPTRSRGNRLHDAILEVYGAMIMRVKARMDAGEDVPDCLVKTLLLTQEQEKLDWEDLCMLSAVFTLGGVHSVRTISLFSQKPTNSENSSFRLPALFSGSSPSSLHIPISRPRRTQSSIR